MTKPRVLIAESRYASHDPERRILESIGAEIILERSDREDVLVDRVKDMDALLVNLAPVTARVIQAMNRCRCISRYGVGVDSVDVKAATARGIPVLNVRNYCNEDVSDHALALLLTCVRRINLVDRRVRQGEWNIPERKPLYRLAGKVLGLIGCGAIGRTLVRKVAGFGLADILAVDPCVSAEEFRHMGVRKVDLDELLAKADFVSIHAPLTETTRHLIGREQLQKMKRTAVLVNTSRGGLVDTNALVEALTNRWIAYAGLDVFEQEPLPSDSPLFSLENCCLTDHVGWYTEESQTELQTLAAQNIVLVLRGEKPLSCVNPTVLSKANARSPSESIPQPEGGGPCG